MGKILSIETSTNICSVALTEGNAIIDSKELTVERSHSGQLIILIQDILKKHKLHVRELAAIAVSKGPGSYTGLRIGVSTAKGLCFAHNIPLIGINSLEALALQARSKASKISLLCPMIDARRMEVYCLLANYELSEITETEAKVIEEGSFGEILKTQGIAFFGNGADKCKEIIKQDNALFLENIFPDASYIGLLAFDRLNKNDFEDLAYFEPFYLKDFMVKKSKKNPLI